MERKVVGFNFAEFGMEYKVEEIQKLMNYNRSEANEILCNLLKQFINKICDIVRDIVNDSVKDYNDKFELNKVIKDVWFESCKIINDMWFNDILLNENAEEIFEIRFQKFVDSVDKEIYEIAKKYPEVGDKIEKVLKEIF